MNIRCNPYLIIVAGIFTLAIAMGVGRLTYTALVAPMISNGLSEYNSGIIASVNYLGYLLGSFGMVYVKGIRTRFFVFTIALITSLATTGLMGLTSSLISWNIIRFFSGLASGACFVLGSAMVFDMLNSLNRQNLSILLYSGVGFGIALSGTVAPIVNNFYGTNTAWVAIALICVPMGVFAINIFKKQNGLVKQEGGATLTKATYSKEYIKLLFAYFLEGLGYIIYATYVIVLVKQETGSVVASNMAWVICGLAAMVSIPIIRKISLKIGLTKSLMLVFFVQAIGVLLPAISSNISMIVLSGLMFGLTFISATSLCLQQSVQVSGASSASTVAVMTAVYSVGQMIGPIIAAKLAETTGSFGISFILSSVVLAIAGTLYLRK